MKYDDDEDWDRGIELELDIRGLKVKLEFVENEKSFWEEKLTEMKELFEAIKERKFRSRHLCGIGIMILPKEESIQFDFGNPDGKLDGDGYDMTLTVPVEEGWEILQLITDQIESFFRQ